MAHLRRHIGRCLADQLVVERRQDVHDPDPCVGLAARTVIVPRSMSTSRQCNACTSAELQAGEGQDGEQCTPLTATDPRLVVELSRVVQQCCDVVGAVKPRASRSNRWAETRDGG